MPESPWQRRNHMEFESEKSLPTILKSLRDIR